MATGFILADRVRLAQGWRQRARGLLGRRQLEPGEGLLLRPCRQVHTWFMRMTIDVVFFDRAHKVVGLCRSLPPFRLSPIFWRAAMALELAAGAAQSVSVGDRLGLQPRDEQP